MRDLLVISNGHGEDAVACAILDALLARPDAPRDVVCWPMVGAGDAYRRRGLEVIGPPNLLPSEGFATLDARLWLSDLAAGWIGTHWRQARAARDLGGSFRLALCVGDVIPMAAASLARLPFLFVGCAKSVHYGPGYGYTAFETWLLRRGAVLTIPRDEATGAALAGRGVRVETLGNPMMDGLEGSGEDLGFREGDVIVAMLAGTRRDAPVNALDLLAAAAACARGSARPERLRFVLPLGDPRHVDMVAELIEADPRARDWTAIPAGSERGLRLDGPLGATALVGSGFFADALRAAHVAVGMAGTGNEQAAGLGVPLVAAPSRGPQGEKYLTMKMRYFGEAALRAPREPEPLARAVLALLDDPERRRRMGEAGRRLMGGPGGSGRIAAAVAAEFARLAVL